MKKTLIAYYKDIEIKVMNTWFKGCSLIIDGETVGHTDKMVHMEINEPFLSTTITTVDGVEPLKVYVDASLNVKLLIEVSGKTIAKVL